MAAAPCSRCLQLEKNLLKLRAKNTKLRAELDALRRPRLAAFNDQEDKKEEKGAQPLMYSPFSRLELQRYGRQMLVKDFGVKGQLKLRGARVLLIGVGGLGSPVALYLAGMGIGTVAVVDDDHVDRSNLHRQIVHDEQGAKDREKKVDSAKRRLRELNPLVQCVTYPVRFTAANADELVKAYDVVVDASDNVDTRYLANDACARQHKPLVSGSALGWEGQVTVFTYDDDANATGCYRCLYPTPPRVAMNCADNGVLGVVPGVIGCIQAMETVKLLTGIGKPLVGVQCVYDAYDGHFRRLTIGKKRNCDCLTCGKRVAGVDKERVVVSSSLPFETTGYNEHTGDASLDPQHRISVRDFAIIRRDALAAKEDGAQGNTNEHYALLDTRDPHQFEMVHFPEAVNLPTAQLMDTDPVASIANLHGVSTSAMTKKRSHELYRTFVICRRGVDSIKATRWLLEHGLLDVFNIDGGYTEYAKEGGVDPAFPMY